MSTRRHIFGVDWGDIGRGALGVGHVAGKLLLNAFAGGAGVDKLEDLEQSKGLLPDWASKPPTLVASKPPKVALVDKKGNKRVLEGVVKVTVYGGTRTDGDGIWGVDKPIRVELQGPKDKTTPEVAAIAVSGGVEEQQAQPKGGIGSVVRVTGDTMSDSNDINLEVVSEPSDEGTVDVFGDLSQDPSVPLAVRQAQQRSADAQARLAATLAKQPRTPAPAFSIQPSAVPLDPNAVAFDPNALDPGSLDSVTDPFADLNGGGEMLGHSDSPGWTEIYGDGDEPAENSNSDYFVGCDVLGAPVAAAIASGAPSSAAASRAAMAAISRTPAAAASSVPASRSAAARAGAAKAAPKRLNAGLIAAASKRVFPKGKPSGRKSVHKVALDNATKVVFNAKNAGVKLNTKLQQIAAKTKVQGSHDVLGGGPGWNEILGAGGADWTEVLGAALPLPKRPSVGRAPTTAKQKAAQRKLERSRDKLAAAIKKARPLGDKAVKKSDDLKKSLDKAKPFVDKLRAKPQAKPSLRGVTKVQGDLGPLRPHLFGPNVLGRDHVGYMPGDPEYDPRLDGPYGSDPSTGQVFDSPQPGYPAGGAAPSSPTDGSSPMFTPPTSTQCVLPEDVPIPTRTPLPETSVDGSPGQDQVWENAPPDAIIYDGVAYGFPSDTLGSFNIFHGQNLPPPAGTKYPDGFIFGQIGSAAPAWVVRDKAGIIANDVSPEQVQNAAMYDNPTENMKKFWEPPASIGTTQAAARNSIARGWGPLIGSGRLHGLQYAMSDDVWFWQAENAPSWYPAVSQADAEVKRLNKEARAAAQAECDAQAALDRIEQAERERDQAAREYDLSMATNEQEVQSAIASAQLQDQQAAFDQQQAQAQAQLQMQAAQAELQWAQQQAALEQQTQQAALEYAQAHPEEVQQEASQQPYQGDGGDQFVDEGAFEGDTTDRAAEEEAFEEADRPMDIDFVSQPSAEIDANPTDFDF